ncbi:MAG: hypothetical protein C00003105_00891 [ANME-2 cluster archaeon HR1]|nr:MAG: hypothetical protein C00003105_00891 [ANME-2 cluster archaeon HR1]
MTVAAPVTTSPPANTPFLEHIPSSSATRVPHFVVARSDVVFGIKGLGDVPMAITTISTSMIYSELSIGTGLQRPDSSGSPSSIFNNSICLTQLFSSPMIFIGLHNNLNITPSSLAFSISSFLAGISSLLRL